MTEVVYKDESYAIIGACMEVYNHLGCGFLEAVYQEALAIEFHERGISFSREAEMLVRYKGRALNTHYRADFVLFDKIILETKATSGLTESSASQILNYLNATGMKLGLLVNFGSPIGLESKRFII